MFIKLLQKIYIIGGYKMPNEREIIPYKVEKGNKPNIDEIIEHCIYGKIQENAKNFIVWLYG